MARHNRRTFLQDGTAGTALALSAASYKKVLGANAKLGIGFVGVGGRCQAHLDIINDMSKDPGDVSAVAVCDVWDGHQAKFTRTSGGVKEEKLYSQGLYPSAKKMGLDPTDKKHVVKDYRRLLDLKEVDVVCIATPDHWHAITSIEALRKMHILHCPL